VVALIVGRGPAACDEPGWCAVGLERRGELLECNHRRGLEVDLQTSPTQPVVSTGTAQSAERMAERTRMATSYDTSLATVARPRRPAQEPATVEVANPMASFSRMVPGEWRVTAI
jgi:hypothetical protein